MPKKENNFENWNSEYDIPDDPKPTDVSNEFSSEEEKHLNRQYMQQKLTDLREEALLLRKKQNNYWDSYGDNYMLDEIPVFILRNKEEIAGVVKDAPWILTANEQDWEEDFRYYYALLVRFIKVSQYAIASYQKKL